MLAFFHTFFHSFLVSVIQKGSFNTYRIPEFIIGTELGICKAGNFKIFYGFSNLWVIKQVGRNILRIGIYFCEETEPQYHHALVGNGMVTDEAAKKIDKKISDKAQDAAREAAGLPAATTTTTTKVDKTDEETFQDVKNILVPSTSDVLYGLIDGSVVSSTWNTLTGKTDQLFSYVLRRTGDSVGGTLGDFLNYLGEGATYVCYSGGKQVAYSTATKYPVIAGGIAIGRSADGKAINRMLQLSPVVIDKLGAASVMSGDKRYETADDMQVYLWSNGQYFATSLPKINTEDYKLIGWYDNFGCSGGKKIRILVAVKTN